MSKELIKLIHNECAPQERLELMRRMDSDPLLRREYDELTALHCELTALFAGAATSDPAAVKPKGTTVFFRRTALAAVFGAAACLLLIFANTKEPPPNDMPQSITTIPMNASAPTTVKDPFEDRRQYVAATIHRRSAAEIEIAKQLSSSGFKDMLEVQSRASAQAKIREIVNAPYLPKVGRDFKPQTTTQEAIEMLLAREPGDSEILFGFAPTLY